MKSIIRRSQLAGKCINYEEIQPDCISRQRCIERCVQQKSMQRFQNITVSFGEVLVLDRSHFTEKEWSRAFVNENQSVYR